MTTAAWWATRSSCRATCAARWAATSRRRPWCRPTRSGRAASASRLCYSYVGAAGNVAGQTVTFTVERSTDNGATWAAIAGATSGALATNSAAPTAAIVSFTPVPVAAGDQIRVVATISADLITALTMVLAEVPDGPPHRFRWKRRLHEIRLYEGPERIAA